MVAPHLKIDFHDEAKRILHSEGSGPSWPTYEIMKTNYCDNWRRGARIDLLPHLDKTDEEIWADAPEEDKTEPLFIENRNKELAAIVEKPCLALVIRLQDCGYVTTFSNAYNKGQLKGVYWHPFGDKEGSFFTSIQNGHTYCLSHPDLGWSQPLEIKGLNVEDVMPEGWSPDEPLDLDQNRRKKAGPEKPILFGSFDFV